jgi:hypothetical protein
MKDQNSTVLTIGKFIAIALGLSGLMLVAGFAHAGAGISLEAITRILDWSTLFSDGFHGGYDAAGAITVLTY